MQFKSTTAFQPKAEDVSVGCCGDIVRSWLHHGIMMADAMYSCAAKRNYTQCMYASIFTSSLSHSLTHFVTQAVGVRDEQQPALHEERVQ
jgi:hypothetical protein